MNNSQIITIDENQTAIHNEIMQKINEGYHLISYSLGMALGKTYNAFKIIEDMFRGKKVLYLAPNKQIIEEIRNKDCFEDISTICNINFKCFASFNVINNDYYNYDVIFIDEMHHIASPKQGKNIRDIMIWYANHGKYVFGFTATPNWVRVDGAVDTRDFFEYHVEGITTHEAIERGILPTPIYSLVRTKQKKKNVSNSRERITVQSSYEVLRSKVDAHPEITKYIAYFPQSLDLLDNYVMMKKLFSDFKLFVTINPGCQITKIEGDINEDIEELLNLIETNKNRENEIIRDMDSYDGKSIILNVGKLLEGSHPETVNGIMFFRDTNNNVIFEQALGRSLHKGSTIQPLFLDIAGAGDRVKEAMENGIEPHDFSKHGERSNKIKLMVDDDNLKKFIDVIDIEAEEIVDKSFPVMNMPRKRYRDITYCNHFDLMRRFFISRNNFTYQLKNIFHDNEKALIDYYLDLNKRIVCGISFCSDEELARKIKKPLMFINRNLDKGMSYEDIIVKATT